MRARTILVTATLLIATVGIIGCNSQSTGGGVNTQASVSGTPPQPPTSSGSMRLISGAAPMQYLLASGGPVRIMDITTGKQVVKTDVPPQSMIKIAENTGVWVGDNRVMVGPLEPGHQYEIWLDRN
jgi:hypothetical protein